MEEENKIEEQQNPNFDADLDKFDEENDDDVTPPVKAEEVELKPKKKPRSEKQIAAFKKAQAVRLEKAAARKAAREKPPPKVDEDEHEQQVEIKTKKKPTKKKKKVVYQEPTSSESSDEEVIAVVKRRKKPKKRAKPAPKVIYDDELESSEDEGHDGFGQHYINVPHQPQIYIA